MIMIMKMKMEYHSSSPYEKIHRICTERKDLKEFWKKNGELWRIEEKIKENVYFLNNLT